jgi:uncharacterized protein
LLGISSFHALAVGASVHHRWRKWFALWAATIALFVSTIGFAAPEPPKLEGRVNDLGGVLSPQGKQRLESELAQYEKKTGHQFAFLSVESLEGRPIEDFAMAVAEKWKLGDKTRDDGLIVIVAKADRQMRIEVGYGLEGAVPDALAAKIIRNEMVPSFRSGDFDGGVERAFGLLMRAAEGESVGVPPRGAAGRSAASRLAPILIFIVVMLLLWGSGSGGGSGGVRRSVLGGGMMGTGWGAFGGGRGGFGGGGFGGGGFGGGGGGFGGGGSSGRW